MRFTKPKNLCGILNSDLYPLVPDKGTKSQLTQCYQTVNVFCLFFQTALWVGTSPDQTWSILTRRGYL